MNVLVDTNVWMDIILDRKEHFDASAAAVTLLSRAEHTPYVCAHAVTTIFYLIARARDDSVARTAPSPHCSIVPGLRLSTGWCCATASPHNFRTTRMRWSTRRRYTPGSTPSSRATSTFWRRAPGRLYARRARRRVERMSYTTTSFNSARAAPGARARRPPGRGRGCRQRR